MSNSKLDPRILSISDLLAQYSLGNFDQPEVELSENLDEIDSIISGINMLGEEIRNRTVSRDFFIDVYNSVSNILLVTNEEGLIIDANTSASQISGYTNDELLKINVFELIKLSDQELNKIRKLKNSHIKQEIDFAKKNGTTFPAEIIWSELASPGGKFKGFLIVASDLTEKKNRQKDILMNITKTQEAERSRVANDLHDSLGQELVGVRMLLSGILAQIQDEDVKDCLNSCASQLDSSLKNIRAICFDLIPSALENGDLIMAFDQLMKKMEQDTGIRFDLNVIKDCIPNLNLDQKIAAYRVFQEFVHNAIKHAQCDQISVSIEQSDSNCSILINDNGKGFDIEALSERDGRGLSTMKSRVEVCGGLSIISSQIGKGTEISIIFKGKPLDL